MSHCTAKNARNSISAVASPQTPRGGELITLPDPLARFKGPTSKGSRVVSVLDSNAEGPGSNRSRDAVV